MTITKEMRETYEKVKHEYLLEDAQYQVEMFLEWHEEYKSYEEVKDKVDYEEMVELFEKYQNCDVAENDTWKEVCYDYFIDNDDLFKIE